MRFHSIDVAHLPADAGALPTGLPAFLWHFFRQAKAPFAFLGVLTLAASTLDASEYYFIKILVDSFGRARDFAGLKTLLAVPVALYVVFVMLLQPFLARYGAYVMANVRPAFTNLVRRQLALYMHNHSYGYFQDDFAGRLASKVIETPSALSGIMEAVVGSALTGITTITVAFIFFAMAYWLFAALALGWLVAYIALLWFFIPRIHEASTRSYDQSSVVRGRFVDTLTNILTVKLFARRDHEDAFLLGALREQMERGQTLMHITNVLQICMSLLGSALTAGSFAIAIVGWSRHALTAGDVAMAVPLTIRLVNMSWWMSYVFGGLFESFGQVQEGMNTITIRQSVIDRADAPALKPGAGRVQFRRVDFSYGAKPVFADFNLDIPAGQKVGLIGPSGAGKSTLIQMLLRLYDVQGGEILIDGQDIEAVRQDSLRQAIAVIPQTADLMHRSIRDNILYGRLDASEEDVVAAATRANAHDFIPALQDRKGGAGYDALAGERGVKLSGGQRQRIAIARAILKDAPILVLDEATSALDSESERLIQASLFKLMQGKTVLAIAHRLSTLTHMDRLVVLDQGRIVEDGSHAELLARGGLYARLWSLQSGGFIAK